MREIVKGEITNKKFSQLYDEPITPPIVRIVHACQCSLSVLQ